MGLALAALALGPACATTSTTPDSSTAATTARTPGVADPEVVVLRERVARLERRLADVDGKLALLLARAEAPPTFTTSAPVKVAQAPRPERPRDTAGWDLASSGPGAGLTSVDIERSPPTAASAHDVPLGEDDRHDDIEDIGAIGDIGDIEDEGGDHGTVVLQMHGDRAPVISHSGGGDVDGEGDGDGDGDAGPLSALRSAKDLYAWGQARLKEGRHLEAVAAFEDVVGRFPKDDLADNSLYWIGVCHQARGEHRLGIAEWQKLPARFPKSPKIPDALYGMAASHEALGEPAVAEVLYDEILASYPKADKHRDAKKAIARLRPSR